MKLNYFSFILIAILISHSCNAQKQEIDSRLYGVWNSIGYGQQLEVSKKNILIRDTYKSGCNLNTKLSTAYLEEFCTINKLTKDSLQIKVGLTNYNFVRSEKSSICKKSKNNPLSNFDALWETFNENYAFFNLRRVDWNKLKNKYRNRLSKKTSDLELYTVLNTMISELSDGHVSIEIPDSLKDKIEDNDEDNDDLRSKVINSLIKNYIPNYKTYNKGMINWGFIKDSISYIQFNDFEDLANYNISNDLTTEEFDEHYWENADESLNYTKDVLTSFKKQMAIIYEDIKNTKFCIIDVRFNGGGFDQIGLEILSYFTNKKRIAFSKKARFKNRFTNTQSIYIEPNGLNYNGKLYLLTSPQTASASETFVLASQNIESVIRVGSNTEGILSDVLSKRLPNGWEYGLSNEIYENANGKNYEMNGIPSDYKFNYNRNAKEFYMNLLTELKTNDKAIEKIIELNK
ncbi:S41 family peptidase [Winogradskyella immobilis]|uniref:S41 family peptidase n=1 Tax=Winogradskyella immobilis TaxID=2816852 RepID=A0ABS8ETC6_9FLAO|nr:S41 family peptidase [Winogradskyella immobilis]MCC1485532.1 S41 family peptidase [Winogradskyella immobilis]MCG0017624.1 S41 family peptidase [Winogradskyella immobilis]